jgi:hypothetical protein
MAFLEVRNLGKTYVTRLGACRVQALKDVSFSVEKGEFIAVMGESGSGKTTLLNILAALDRPDSGDVLLEGKSLSGIAEKELAAFRRDNLGFVFQDFNLLDTFSVRDNILLPLVLKRTGIKQMEERLAAAAGQLGLTELLDKYPYELSGGQKQRTAVGRAIITSPALLLADEPTGALDSHQAQRLMELFCRLNGGGQTVIMVTHSVKAASYASRVLFLRDGQVFHQLCRGDKSAFDMQGQISDALSMVLAGEENE